MSSTDNLPVFTETPQLIIPWWWQGMKVFFLLHFIAAAILTVLVSTNTISAWWALLAIWCYGFSFGMAAK